jgi:hypothetical protein
MQRISTIAFSPLGSFFCREDSRPEIERNQFCDHISKMDGVSKRLRLL